MIRPSRTAGNQRIYSSKNRVRLQLILRSKRFGYTLDEIAKMIGLADVEVNEVDQIRTVLAYGDRKLREIRHRMTELKAMEADMVAVRQKLVTRMAELDKGKSNV